MECTQSLSPPVTAPSETNDLFASKDKRATMPNDTCKLATTPNYQFKLDTTFILETALSLDPQRSESQKKDVIQLFEQLYTQIVKIKEKDVIQQLQTIKEKDVIQQLQTLDDQTLKTAKQTIIQQLQNHERYLYRCPLTRNIVLPDTEFIRLDIQGDMKDSVYSEEDQASSSFQLHIDPSRPVLFSCDETGIAQRKTLRKEANENTSNSSKHHKRSRSPELSSNVTKRHCPSLNSLPSNLQKPSSTYHLTYQIGKEIRTLTFNATERISDAKDDTHFPVTYITENRSLYQVDPFDAHRHWLALTKLRDSLISTQIRRSYNY
ncbi:MAG: hypothetical protein VW378_03060 [bacterium]